MIENDEFLEHAEYVSNCYGTPRAYVEKKLSEGMNVLLDIEVQGALQVHEKMPEAVMIFFVPPSLEELEKRLKNRGTDTPEKIAARLKRAREEYKAATFYDYIIVNDDADKAANELLSIITAEKCRYDIRKNILNFVNIPSYLEIIYLQIGFPFEENFSSYSVIMLPSLSASSL